MGWQEKADLAMADLQESYESPVYQRLLEWIHCQYEAEKDALVMASAESLPEHFMKVKALREFKLMLSERAME